MFPNTTFTGVGLANLNFNQQVNSLQINVENSPIGISVDAGKTFMTLAVGTHALSIGTITKMRINGAGKWQIIGSFYVFNWEVV